MRALRTIVLLVIAATACGPYPPEVNPPCGVEGVSRVDLGRPALHNTQADFRTLEDGYAEFTTSGGDLYATAYGYSHGGLVDREQGRDKIFFGQGTPEQVGEELDPVNAQTSVWVFENDYTPFKLPAGHYWVTGTGAYLEIVSCDEGGVSNARAVPSASPIEPSGIVPPCGNQGLSRVELGSPTLQRFNRYQDLSHHARFSTNGAEFYVTATNIQGSVGPADAHPYANVYVGWGEPRRHPGYVGGLAIFNDDEARAVPEDDFWQLQLRAGTYWVLTSPAANVSIVSCQEGGVYGARPAPPAQDTSRQ